MEKSVRIAEREYSKKMTELNRGFEVCSFEYTDVSWMVGLLQEVSNSFAGMESKMNEVSSTAIRIGWAVLCYLRYSLL
jgi:exocyst complex component 5